MPSEIYDQNCISNEVLYRKKEGESTNPDNFIF